MAMQLPVITTPIAGIPELVCDEETGLLVPERDAHAITLAIERLIKDPSLRSKLGQQGRRTIIGEYDIHHTAAKMASIFSEICGC
jgi:glycosyltransferase involved in cell wall biosynthesis